MFKKSFKFYKAKAPEPDFGDVLDFDKISIESKMNKNCDEIIKIDLSKTKNVVCPPGVVDISKWKCYKIKTHPGLIFLKNPFTKAGQRYWIARCLQDYPIGPNKVNLSPKKFNNKQIENWWKSLQELKNDSKSTNNDLMKLKNSMRWTTLGYHHDWDTKIYSENMKNYFPNDLAKLSAFFAEALDFDKYSAEAAIVNYYPIGTTLAGHTDHSEMNLDAPLFSFSFGQMAIFLIGGTTIDDKPTALFIKSGDIIIMSKDSRLCYHAVPRVMKTKQEPWNLENENNVKENEKKLDECIKNYLSTAHNEIENSDDPPAIKKTKSSSTNNLEDSFIYTNLFQKCMNENFWSSFNEYIKDSRININVRQVLKEGQLSL